MWKLKPFFKQQNTLKQFFAFKMTYSYCFSSGGNLHFLKKCFWYWLQSSLLYFSLKKGLCLFNILFGYFFHLYLRFKYFLFFPMTISVMLFVNSVTRSGNFKSSWWQIFSQVCLKCMVIFGPFASKSGKLLNNLQTFGQLFISTSGNTVCEQNFENKISISYTTFSNLNKFSYIPICEQSFKHPIIVNYD